MSAAPSAYPPVFAACSQRVGVGSPGSSRAGRPAIVDTSAVALLGGTENMSSAVLRTEPSTQQTAIAHDKTLSERHASKTGLIVTWPRSWWLPPGGRIPPSPRPIRPLNRFQSCIQRVPCTRNWLRTQHKHTHTPRRVASSSSSIKDAGRFRPSIGANIAPTNHHPRTLNSKLSRLFPALSL